VSRIHHGLPGRLRQSALLAPIAVVVLMAPLAARGLLAGRQTVPRGSSSTSTGEVTRGKTLYERTFACYACHGFDGQSGSPRLIPMQRSEAAFIAFLRKPPREAMPKFADVPERDLADVYAYIRSIPVAAPPLDSIPLLKGVLDRRARTTGKAN
jgi:mono/diheme cytochrome c family protein